MTGDTPSRALDADGDGQPDFADGTPVSIDGEVSDGVVVATPQSTLEAIPKPVRQGLYIVYAVGGPVLIYLQSRGLVGESELALWAGVGSVLGLTALGNTNAR